MKYYILDLSPQNSLVRYLVEKGHTVFMISWKNPDAADRELGMDDYVRDGFLEALAAGSAASSPGNRCTRSATASAAPCSPSRPPSSPAARSSRFASVSLFAAQTDFSEPGELSVFITPEPDRDA